MAFDEPSRLVIGRKREDLRSAAALAQFGARGFLAATTPLASPVVRRLSSRQRSTTLPMAKDEPTRIFAVKADPRDRGAASALAELRPRGLADAPCPGAMSLAVASLALPATEVVDDHIRPTKRMAAPTGPGTLALTVPRPGPVLLGLEPEGIPQVGVRHVGAGEQASVLVAGDAVQLRCVNA
jgi:hypothetical protein